MWHNSNERDKVPNATNHNKFLSNKCSPWEQIPNVNATNIRQILTWCRAFLESKFQIRSMKLKLVKLCSPWEPKHQSIQRTVLQLWVPQIEPWLKHLFPEYCFLYLLQKCHFKYTVYVSLYLYLYVEELFALTEKQQQKMAPSSTMCSPVTWLSCDRRCEPKRRYANKNKTTKKKVKNKTNRIK